MGDSLKLFKKKAFRKPSADCSFTSACITHLYSKSLSLRSTDEGKESRKNQNDLKKNNGIYCCLLFFLCTLLVFYS